MASASVNRMPSSLTYPITASPVVVGTELRGLAGAVAGCFGVPAGTGKEGAFKIVCGVARPGVACGWPVA